MNYQEQYHKLIEELTELEDKKEQLQHVFSKKKEEEYAKKQECRILINYLDKLERQKETMQFSKKTNKLSTTFAILSVVFPSSIMFFTLASNFIYNNTALQTLTNIFCIGLPVSVVSMLATMYIGKKIVQKEFNKIKNSDEYQKIVKEIKTKEKDKKIVNDKLLEISKEVAIALTEFNSQKKLVEAKLTEIEYFKNEVFYSIVDAPVQGEEESRQYTRVRRKEDD